MYGKVIEVKGPVVDVLFEDGNLPNINDALKIHVPAEENHGVGIQLTLEVALHIGNKAVRCIAMDSTDGLVCGMPVENTEHPILVPVGKKTLGRLFNVLGEPIDNKDALEKEVHMPIHRDAPKLEELSSTVEILETGIKVVDLLAPYIKVGTIGYYVVVV